MRYQKAFAVVLVALAIGCGDDRVAPRKLGATYSSVGYLTSCSVTSPLSGACTSGSPLAISAASANAAGSLAASDYSKLATMGAGGLVTTTIRVAVDYTTPATYAFTIPSNGSQLFFPIQMKIEIEKQTGTASATLNSIPVLNGTNYGSTTSSIATASLNAAGAKATYNGANQLPILTPGTDTFGFKVTQAPTGLTVCSGHASVIGYYADPSP